MEGPLDYYWYYITRAAKHLDIRLSSEVKTKNGYLLEAGLHLTPSVCKRLSVSLSVESIETVLYVSPDQDDGSLLQDLMHVRDKFDAFETLFDPKLHNYYLNLALKQAEEQTSLAFRLYILKCCLPVEYERTLFCVLWAILDSEILKRSSEKFVDLALVCLSHDLGLLEVNPEFAKDDHDPRTNAKDKGGYYDHTRYGERFVARCAGGKISSTVKNGVLQHHESIDGTGYPKGLSGVFLNEYGQMVHLYDTLFSIYQKYYKPIGKSLSDLKPIIEINAVTHFGACANRVIELLSKLPKNSSVFFNPEDYEGISRKVGSMEVYVEKSIGIIQKFTENVGFRHDNKQLFILQNSFIHIALSYHKMSDQLKMTVEREEKEGDKTRRESSKLLEESFLSLREIIFHIKELHLRLSIYLKGISEDVPTYEYCCDAIKELETLHAGRISSS